MARPDVRRPPVAAAARDLLSTARHDLATAMTTTVAIERYAAAHLAALRTAAAVLAVRTRPDSTTRRRPRTVWSVLPQVAPELTEWAGFFAAGRAECGRRCRGGPPSSPGGAGRSSPRGPGGARARPA